MKGFRYGITAAVIVKPIASCVVQTTRVVHMCEDEVSKGRLIKASLVSEKAIFLCRCQA